MKHPRILTHLIENIFNLPMLATPELMYQAVIFAQTHLGLVISGHDAQPIAPQLSMSDEAGESVEDSDQDDGTGVAQIGIYGPLVSRTGNLQMCSRMTAYETISTQLRAALANPTIARIALDIDTGGGDARGCFELARQIRAATLVKPVHGIVNFSAYSGGYLIASACTDISISTTGGVGSIGVIMKTIDISEAYKQAGVVVNTFYRGDRKNDFAPDTPLSDGARTAADARMDAMYDLFTRTVADYRRIPLAAVVLTQAGCYYGQDALDAGLADRLEDPQDAFDRIVGLAREDRLANPAPAPAPTPTAFSAHAQRLRLAQACDATIAMQTHPQ